jgi:ABC-type proline/glycine betaine transport system permease subunit
VLDHRIVAVASREGEADFLRVGERFMMTETATMTHVIDHRWIDLIGHAVAHLLVAGNAIFVTTETSTGEIVMTAGSCQGNMIPTLGLLVRSLDQERLTRIAAPVHRIPGMPQVHPLV